MKNGIAMISNFSMPVNSFSATDSIGTWVIVNRKVSTVRPSEIEIGMPVSIRTTSRPKMMRAFIAGLPVVLARSPAAFGSCRLRGASRRCGGRRPWMLEVVHVQVVVHAVEIDVDRRHFVFEAVDMAVVVVRQFAGADERQAHLQEAEAHQVGAERNGAVDDPGRPFEVGRGRAFVESSPMSMPSSVEDGVVRAVFPDEVGAERADDAGEQRAGQQAEDDELAAHAVVEPVDQHVDADVDAGAHAVGGTELGHPDEHDDAQFLRPAEIEGQQPVLQAGNGDPGHVAMHDRDEDDQRRRRPSGR